MLRVVEIELGENLEVWQNWQFYPQIRGVRGNSQLPIFELKLEHLIFAVYLRLF